MRNFYLQKFQLELLLDKKNQIRNIEQFLKPNAEKDKLTKLEIINDITEHSGLYILKTTEKKSNMLEIDLILPIRLYLLTKKN